ncbi:hypothetical protein T439DRAFT_327621 [Meredithblackwellia eburnea MCA 4105]
MPEQLPIYPRINVFGDALIAIPTNGGPTTGFFRNNFADATPLDRASHTVAAILTPAFLQFSASRGNDLSPLFPTTGPLSPAETTRLPLLESPTKWAICASRWQEAFEARYDVANGDAIVPRVILEATHERALDFIKLEHLQMFAVGGNGDLGATESNGSASNGSGSKITRERIGR